MVEKAKIAGLATAAMIAAAVFLSGCKSGEQTAQTAPSEQPKTESSAPPAAPPPAESQPPAAAAAKPAEAQHNYTKELLAPAKLKEKAPDTYKVRLDTTRGAFTVTVTRAWAPIGADRFYNLVKHHFFDNTAFFRVVPGFVVQFGINGNPAVSAAWKNMDIKDDPVTQSNKRGTLTFAQTSQPNSRGTQLFFNLKDNGQLDRMGQGFAPFGVVDGNGMNVVDMMYEGYGDNAGPDQDQLAKQGDTYLKKGWPKLDYIKSATLVE
jgi:peptidyl-prolyl cis-trans isomerase A (cyclophilin A)